MKEFTIKALSVIWTIIRIPLNIAAYIASYGSAAIFLLVLFVFLIECMAIGLAEAWALMWDVFAVLIATFVGATIVRAIAKLKFN